MYFIEKIGFLLLVFFITCAASCGSKEPDFVDQVRTELVLPISIEPITEKLKIGDTIKIRAHFPDTIKEFYTGKYFKLENINFGTRILLYEVSDPNKFFIEQPAAAGNYDVVNYIGGIKDLGSSAGNFEFVYQNGFYVVNAALIPKNKGLYLISFYYYTPDNVRFPKILLPPHPNGTKREAVMFAHRYFINDGKTNHNLLIKNVKRAIFKDTLDGNYWFEKYGTFTFEVK
jgi:hypothetical protein